MNPATPLNWNWPAAPQSLEMYDKYSDTHTSLSLRSKTWTVPTQGRLETFRLRRGPQGMLQAKLAFLTQGNNPAPPSFCKFTRSLLAGWDCYLDIMACGPTHVRARWKQHVSNVDTSKAGKALLRLACRHSVGPWDPRHTDLVKSLATHASSGVRRQKARIEGRHKLLPVAETARIVKALDEHLERPSLEEGILEGLCALVLFYQHGVRPVQALSLKREDVDIVSGLSNEALCTVTFHWAKQHDGALRFDSRAVQPSWSIYFQKLQALATEERRTRLFKVSTSQALWTQCKRLLKGCDTKVVSPNAIRHTSAQRLADTGHHLETVQSFLMQMNPDSALVYLRATNEETELINRALGFSTVYTNVLRIAQHDLVSVSDLEHCDEGEQVGGVLGDRLVAGIGKCRSGQSKCPYDPVTSCYGCHKFIPADNKPAHLEAIQGMREVVVNFCGSNVRDAAFFQLSEAIANAQSVVRAIDQHHGNAQLDCAPTTGEHKVEL